MAALRPKLKATPKFTIPKGFTFPKEQESVVSKINEVIKKDFNEKIEHLNFKDFTENIRKKQSKTLFRSGALRNANRPLIGNEIVEHHLLEHLNVLYHSILIDYKKISTQHINLPGINEPVEEIEHKIKRNLLIANAIEKVITTEKISSVFKK